MPTANGGRSMYDHDGKIQIESSSVSKSSVRPNVVNVKNHPWAALLD
jgi:hypothetical protein